MKKLPPGEQVEMLHELVECCVTSIVEHEDRVRIKVDQPNNGRVVFTVFVAPSDMGLALGKSGETLDAVRRIAWTACKKTDLRCDIDILTNGER